MSNPLSSRENKWHLELNATFGVNFWNNVYKLTSSIKRENRIKWLQFQINRNTLYTNYKINKFAPQISPHCGFCSDVNTGFEHLELVSHLFYDCTVVLKLWEDWFLHLTPSINIPIEKNNILCGVREESFDSIANFVILCGKYYVWKTKQTSGILSMVSFKNFLKRVGKT